MTLRGVAVAKRSLPQADVLFTTWFALTTAGLGKNVLNSQSACLLFQSAYRLHAGRPVNISLNMHEWGEWAVLMQMIQSHPFHIYEMLLQSSDSAISDIYYLHCWYIVTGISEHRCDFKNTLYVRTLIHTVRPFIIQFFQTICIL